MVYVPRFLVAHTHQEGVRRFISHIMRLSRKSRAGFPNKSKMAGRGYREVGNKSGLWGFYGG